MKQHETVIGLEVHVELWQQKQKFFCGCSTEFEEHQYIHAWSAQVPGSCLYWGKKVVVCS